MANTYTLGDFYLRQDGKHSFDPYYNKTLSQIEKADTKSLGVLSDGQQVYLTENDELSDGTQYTPGLYVLKNVQEIDGPGGLTHSFIVEKLGSTEITSNVIQITSTEDFEDLLESNDLRYFQSSVNLSSENAPDFLDWNNQADPIVAGKVFSIDGNGKLNYESPQASSQEVYYTVNGTIVVPETVSEFLVVVNGTDNGFIKINGNAILEEDTENNIKINNVPALVTIKNNNGTYRGKQVTSGSTPPELNVKRYTAEDGDLDGFVYEIILKEDDNRVSINSEILAEDFEFEYNNDIISFSSSNKIETVENYFVKDTANNKILRIPKIQNYESNSDSTVISNLENLIEIIKENIVINITKGNKTYQIHVTPSGDYYITQ